MKIGWAVSRARFLSIPLGVVCACGSSQSPSQRPNPPADTASAGAAGMTASAAGSDGVVGGDGNVGQGGESGQAGESDAGPFSLGATWGADVVHFRVRAAPATALELFVYAKPRGADEVARFPMARADNVWSADVSRAQLSALGVTTVYYGYRAWGPNWLWDSTWEKGSSAGFVSDVDALGNRYDPNKLLIDPYAREISHDPLQPDALSAAPYETGELDRAIDDGQAAPKSIALPRDTSATGTPPSRALKDDVIYEVNVRGLTMNDPSVPVALRGTFAGAATKAPTLSALGVTAVELLPIQETQNDQNDADTGAQNYWGYSTLAFFAPDRRYSSDKTPGGPTRELKAMVKALHESGIKVFVDVVYNHTAEGGTSAAAPSVAQVLSFRGLDNAGYYELTEDAQSFVDDTGTGANFGTATGLVRDLVVDSLTYWKSEMGIDGFRFDLGAVLGNSCKSSCYLFAPDDPLGILARAVNELPARPASGGSGVDLIAEPWGLGSGTYQLGEFPVGWSEWNGSFRDVIRTAQDELGTTPITPRSIAQRVAGSPDLFDHAARAPDASINYVDCHDGFTLHDEYAYNAPQNAQPYPLGPSDGGSSENDSWDQSGAPEAQAQAARTGLALVAMSAGVPMIQGGDEFLRTQYGNNNAYNLDNSKFWLDWSLAETNADFVSWTTALFAFRAAHPALRPAHFFDGTDHDANGLPDITWLDSAGNAASDAYLDDATNHFLAWRLDGSEAQDPARSLLVAWNGWTGAISMPLPVAGAGFAWWVVSDSKSGILAMPGKEMMVTGTTLTVSPRTVSVLIER